MELNEALRKAYQIGQKAQFKVKVYSNDDDIKEQKEMTYIELGSYLIVNSSKIKKVDIIFKWLDNYEKILV